MHRAPRNAAGVFVLAARGSVEGAVIQGNHFPVVRSFGSCFRLPDGQSCTGSGGRIERGGHGFGSRGLPTPASLASPLSLYFAFMPPPSILVVDDEQLIRWSLTSRLTRKGTRSWKPRPPPTHWRAVAEGVDLVLLDYRLPDSNGLTVLKQIKEHDPDILVILLTGYSSVKTAVEAMRLGAYHYINKPFDLDEIVLLVEKALETTALRREVRALRASQAQPYSLDRIVGDDDSVVSAARDAQEDCRRTGIDRAAHG